MVYKKCNLSFLLSDHVPSFFHLLVLEVFLIGSNANLKLIKIHIRKQKYFKQNLRRLNYIPGGASYTRTPEVTTSN
jgi:hypothetical protein